MNRTLRKCCAALLAILAVYAAPAAEKTVYLKDFLAPGAAGTDAVPAVIPLKDEAAEKESIANALRVCNGHRGQAAQLLNINPATLYRKMKKHGLK